jgi:hypothetical protein
MKRLLLIAVVLAAAAGAVLYVTGRSDDPAPSRDVVIRVDAEASVCWTALLDAGDDPLGEPRNESDCGSRQLSFAAGDLGTVAVSKTGEAGELSVVILKDGTETQRRSTGEPRGTVVLEL